MPLMNGRRADTGGKRLTVALIGTVSVGGVLWVTLTPSTEQSSTLTVAGNPQSSVTESDRIDARERLVNVLPASLAGTSAPRLPIDGRGHLAHTASVRDFFDYFLTTQNEVSAATLDALVRRQIAAQLDGTAAAGEALSAWQRYTEYRAALDRLPQTVAAAGEKADLDALQRYVDQRDALAVSLLGEWQEPFFGTESQQQRADLERLRIVSDSSLNSEQKATRLAALDAALPPETRAAHERVRQQQMALESIDQAQKQGGSLDTMRAQITQTLGPEAAERVVQMQQADNAWQARYTDYSNERAQIDQQDLPPQQREAQIAQLRQQFFTNTSDAMRAASLDRDSGSAN